MHHYKNFGTGVVGEVTKSEKYTVARTGTLGGGQLELKVLQKAVEGLIKLFADIAKKTNYEVTAVLGLLDIDHSQTANSGLTKVQRTKRTLFKLAAIGAVIAARVVIATIFAAGIAATSAATTVGYILVGELASYGSGSFIDYEQSKLSRKCGLG